jgi:hypothetical protein
MRKNSRKLKDLSKKLAKLVSDIRDPAKAKRAIYRKSLYAFAKKGLGYGDMEPRSHGPICQVLESKNLRKLITVPRGTFKSSIGVVAYAIWKLEQNPDLRILIDSEVYTNSKNFLREIKGHLKSRSFIEMWGDWEGDIWTEKEITISRRTKIRKESNIVCSGLGAIKTSQHYDLIISDDLSSQKNTLNPEVAKKTIDHFRLYTSLLDPGGEIVVIGTRYSENDLIGFILRELLGLKDGNPELLKEISR